MIAQDEADQANAANPLKSQFSALKMIKKTKYKSPIVDASIWGERGSKIKDPKAIVTIYRKDGTSTTHFHSQIETFGYYEWLEMREVIQKEKST